MNDKNIVLITSPQNLLIKKIIKLKTNRSFKKKEGLIILEGRKIIDECPFPLLALLSTEDFPFQAESYYKISTSLLKQIADTSTPEPYLALIKTPPWQDLPTCNKLLVLDGVADPGNLGTLIRTSLAMNFDGVFLLNRCCDPYSTKAVRSSKGAVLKTKLQQGGFVQLNQIIEKNRLTCYLADLNGSDVNSFNGPLALILGSESNGPSHQIKSSNNIVVTIPISHQVNSLNVAIAGAILMDRINRGFSCKLDSVPC